MKAAVYHRYGSPDVIRIEDIGKPVPARGEVLVKVRAAAVSPLDSHLMRGRPYVARLAFGLRAPRLTRPGVDVAGEVEAVGFGPLGEQARQLCEPRAGQFVRSPRTGTAAQSGLPPPLEAPFPDQYGLAAYAPAPGNPGQRLATFQPRESSQSPLLHHLRSTTRNKGVVGHALTIHPKTRVSICLYRYL